MTLPTNHYVDNTKFYEACVEHRAKSVAAAEAGLPKPQISNYIGECLLKIATKLSYSRNFINYGFREEMICDGVENCILYFHNFNPEKYNKPFAYFTQIIYYAFLRRIQKEKRQMYIRHKVMLNQADEGLADVNGADGSSNDEYALSIDEALTSNDYIKDFVTTYEAKMKAIKLGAQSKSVHKSTKTKNTRAIDECLEDEVSDFEAISELDFDS